MFTLSEFRTNQRAIFCCCECPSKFGRVKHNIGPVTPILTFPRKGGRDLFGAPPGLSLIPNGVGDAFRQHDDRRVYGGANQVGHD